MPPSQADTCEKCLDSPTLCRVPQPPCQARNRLVGAIGNPEGAERHAAEPSRHTIDFAAFEHEANVDLTIFSASSLAVTLEPSKTVVKLAPLDVTARPARALLPSDASICIPEHPFLAIPPEEGELAAGESTSLVSMDVAFFGRVDDSGPKLTGPYFLCFGTRSADGSWQTWFRKAEILYDAPSNELRAHYVFDEGVKADAVRLLVTGALRPATPKRIVYRTRVTP